MAFKNMGNSYCIVADNSAQHTILKYLHRYAAKEFSLHSCIKIKFLITIPSTKKIEVRIWQMRNGRGRIVTHKENLNDKWTH